MKNLVFLGSLLMGAWVHADSKEVIAEIEKNVCAEASDKSKTEGEGICLDCIYGTQSTPALPKELKGVDLALKKQELDKAKSDLELKFFRLLKEKNYIKFNSSGYSEQGLKDQIKSYESYKKTQKDLLDQTTEVIKNKDQYLEDLKVAKESGKIQGYAKSHLEKSFKQTLDFVSAQETQTKKSIETFQKKADEAVSEEDKKAYLDYVKLLEKNLEEYKKSYQPYIDADKWLKSEGGTPLPTAIVNSLSAGESVVTSAASNLNYYKQSVTNYEKEIANWQKILDSFVPDSADLTPEQQKKALEAFHKNAKKFEFLMKSNSGFKDCGLSPAEKTSLYVFTGSGYYWMNKALKAGGSEAEKVAPFLTVFNSALKKLKSYDGDVFQSLKIPDEQVSLQTPGTLLSYDAFTSTTLNASSSTPGKTNYIIRSKTGRYVGSHSAVYEEGEVVFSPKTQFKILSVEGNNIVMEEATP